MARQIVFCPNSSKDAVCPKDSFLHVWLFAQILLRIIFQHNVSPKLIRMMFSHYRSTLRVNKQAIKVMRWWRNCSTCFMPSLAQLLRASSGSQKASSAPSQQCCCLFLIKGRSKTVACGILGIFVSVKEFCWSRAPQ